MRNKRSIVVDQITAKRSIPKQDTPDYKVMPFQGEIKSLHL